MERTLLWFFWITCLFFQIVHIRLTVTVAFRHASCVSTWFFQDTSHWRGSWQNGNKKSKPCRELVRQWPSFSRQRAGRLAGPSFCLAWRWSHARTCHYWTPCGVPLLRGMWWARLRTHPARTCQASIHSGPLPSCSVKRVCPECMCKICHTFLRSHIGQVYFFIQLRQGF